MDVDAAAAERAIEVRRVRVGHVVQPAVRAEVVVGVADVVAVASEDVVPTRAADQPVAAEVAEEDIVAIGGAEGGGEARAVRRGLDASEHEPAVRGAVGRVEVEEVLPRRRSRAGLPDLERERVEHDRAARIELVVQEELTQARRVVVVRVPRVRVRPEVQDVARVERTRPVGPHEAVRAVDLLVADRVVRLHVGHEQGLITADRVVADGAVDEVIVQTAEQDVVGVVRVVVDLVAQAERIGRLVVRREVELLLQESGHVDRRGLHLAGRVDELAEHVALARARVGIGLAQAVDAVERLGELRADRA